MEYRVNILIAISRALKLLVLHSPPYASRYTLLPLCSPMSATVKLTKKQKKGIAFRERKTGARRSKDGNGTHNSEDNDVPIMEDQDALAAEGAPMEMEEADQGKKSKSASKVSRDDDRAKGKHKATADEEGDTDTERSGKTKKRKRQDADVDVPDVAADEKPVAKRKKSVEEAGESGQNTKVAAKSKQRFILFLGEKVACFSLYRVLK